MQNGNIAILIVCLLGLSGCAHSQPVPLADSTAASPGADRPISRIPDPSVELCLQDGHQLAPVRKDGIVQSYFCINPKIGLKCDSWAYYRGECSLDRQKPQHGGPASDHRPTSTPRR